MAIAYVLYRYSPCRSYSTHGYPLGRTSASAQNGVALTIFVTESPWCERWALEYSPVLLTCQAQLRVRHSNTEPRSTKGGQACKRHPTDRTASFLEQLAVSFQAHRNDVFVELNSFYNFIHIASKMAARASWFEATGESRDNGAENVSRCLQSFEKNNTSSLDTAGLRRIQG